jgi:hypothetical protein
VAIRRTLFRTAVGGAVIAVSAGAVACNAGWQRMEDLRVACQMVFEEDKFDFQGYHWGWLPPAWVCEFRAEYGRTYERRLPFGRRG